MAEASKHEHAVALYALRFFHALPSCSLRLSRKSDRRHAARAPRRLSQSCLRMCPECRARAGGSLLLRSRARHAARDRMVPRTLAVI